MNYVGAFIAGVGIALLGSWYFVAIPKDLQAQALSQAVDYYTLREKMCAMAKDEVAKKYIACQMTLEFPLGKSPEKATDEDR